jgi:hypothetical protein
MKVLVPTTITDATLVDSSVPELDYDEWSPDHSYAVDDMCRRAAAHRVYKATVPSKGIDPVGDATGHWIDAGPTNRWAMLDQVVGTETVATGSITVTLAAGVIGALAVIDTNADTVRVQVSLDGALLYDQSQTTNAGGEQIQDWYQYFFADVGKVTSIIFEGLPLQAGAQAKVTITGPDAGGPVSVGTLLVGGMFDLGLTETGPQIGINDYSRKDTDDFGAVTIVERAWAKKVSLKAMIDTGQADSVQRRLAALRARAALYVGESGFDCLAVYGFWKSFNIDMALEEISYVSLDIEGLI